MKKIFLSLCFAAFLSAGLSSCSDEAAEITPNQLQKTDNQMIVTDSDDEPGKRRP